MDLQAAETAHIREKKEQVSQTKKSWNCPCQGCKKAVKQERERILEELNKIELDDRAQLNALGMKMLIESIIKAEEKK